MSLTPKPSDFIVQDHEFVVVYLDDVQLLADNLAPHGPVQILAMHSGSGVTSVVSDVTSLVGRDDIWKIEVKIELAEQPGRVFGITMPISVDMSFTGVAVMIDKEHPELVQVADHFTGQLAHYKPRRYRDRTGMGPARARLVMDTRRSAWESTRNRAWEVKLGLMTALGGAVVGSVLTWLLTR